MVRAHRASVEQNAGARVCRQNAAVHTSCTLLCAASRIETPKHTQVDAWRGSCDACLGTPTYFPKRFACAVRRQEASVVNSMQIVVTRRILSILRTSHTLGRLFVVLNTVRNECWQLLAGVAAGVEVEWQARDIGRVHWLALCTVSCGLHVLHAVLHLALHRLAAMLRAQVEQHIIIIIIIATIRGISGISGN